MTHPIKFLAKTAIAMLVIALPHFVQAAEDEKAEANTRAMAVQIEAEVVAINLDTRQVSLKVPGGHVATVTATEKVVKLEDVSVGDMLVVTYLSALEGELREPTEEELAEPWAVIEEAGASDDKAMPGIGAARIIRAVVTIEGMNRVLGTVTVLDSRGMLHVIADVEAEKMTGVTLGQTLVLIYAEALALTLEHKQAAAE